MLQLGSWTQRGVDRDHGNSSGVDGVDDLATKVGVRTTLSRVVAGEQESPVAQQLAGFVA